MRTIRIPKQKRGPNGEPLCRWCEAPVPKGRRTFCGADCVHEAMLRSDPGYLRRKTKERDKGICGICGRDTEAMKTEYLRVGKLAREGIDAYQRTRDKALKRYGVKGSRWWDVQHHQDRPDVMTQIEIERSRAIAAWERNAEYFANQGKPNRPHPDDDIGHTSRWKAMLQRAIELTDEERRMLKAHKRLKRLAEARRLRIAADLRAEGFAGSIDRYRLTNLWQADHIKPVAEGGGLCGLENIQTACTPCHKRKTAEQAARAALIRRGIDPDAPPEPDPQLTLL